ncbi:MAG: hypothetical protein P1V51_23230, partial [Deltaproteobacteria bacterium]|nr:hypothetical protein [Deltaproteobacteria bacterium]
MNKRTPTLLTIAACALAVVFSLLPREAVAWPTKYTSCTSCHTTAGTGVTLTTAIDGTLGTSVTVAPGGSFEIDFRAQNMAQDTFIAFELGVPTGWTVGVGTANSPAISAWNSVWDAAGGAGWYGAKNQSSTPYSMATQFPNSPDGRVSMYDLTTWSNNGRGAACDNYNVSTLCTEGTDHDGLYATMGVDAIVNVPGGATPGAFTVVLNAIGHNSASKAYATQTISVTVSAGDSTTLSDGTNPGSATIAPGGGITALDGFHLQASGTADTVTGLDVTLSGSSAYVAQVEVRSGTTCGGTPIGSDITPTGEVWSIAGTLPASLAGNDYTVCLTP